MSDTQSVKGVDFDALFNLRGKTALITGASSGIGLHVARLYARAGASVALAARRIDRIETAAQELRDAGHHACAVPMDLLDDASIGAAMDSAEAQLGKPLNLLFNNAGVLYAARFLDQDMADTFREKGFDQNLISRTPIGRFGQLPDLDGAALLLASDAGRYMTGVSLTVDGGQLLSWM